MPNAVSEFQRRVNEAYRLLRRMRVTSATFEDSDREQIAGSRSAIDSSRELMRRVDGVMARR